MKSSLSILLSLGLVSIMGACKTNSGAGSRNAAGTVDNLGGVGSDGEASVNAGTSAFGLVDSSVVSHPRNTNVIDVLPTDGFSGGFNPATGNMLVQLPGGAIFVSRSGFANGAFGSGTSEELVTYIKSNSPTAPTSLTAYSVNGDVETYTQNSISKYFVSKNTNDWIRFVNTTNTFELVTAEGNITVFSLKGDKYRPTKVTSYGIVQTTFNYDPTTWVVTSVNNRSGLPLTQYTYVPGTRRVASITDVPSGTTTAFTYTSSGTRFNLTGVTTPSGSYTIAWDSIGVGTVNQFDGPRSITAPGGIVVARYAFYADGSISAVGDGLNNWTYFRYSTDAVDVQQPASQTATYKFTSGILNSIQSKSAPTQYFTWNADGTLASRSGGTDSVTYTYDTDGNVKEISTKSGSATMTQQFTYRTVSSSAPQPHVLLTAKTLDPSGVNAFLSQTTYDYSGSAPNLFQTTVNTIGKTSVNNYSTTRGLDSAGRLISMTVNSKIVARYTYDSVSGLLTSSQDQNGIVTNYTKYDSYDRLLESSQPELQVTKSVTLDSKGRASQITDPTGTSTVTFDGDSCRVLSASTPTGSRTISYDSAGRAVAFNDVVTSTGSSNNTYYAYSADNATTTCTVNGQQACSNSCMKNAGASQCPTGQFPCSCPNGQTGPNGLCCLDTSTNQCNPY